jgi:hypothetical protein
MDLLSPLAMELQCCDSIDGILAILQRQANTIEQLKDGNKGLTEWITSSVNILLLFSGTLGDGVSLVRHGLRTRICVPSNVIVRRSHLRNNLYWNWCPPHRLYPRHSFLCLRDLTI